LEAYVCVGLARELRDEISKGVASAFDEERARLRRAHRRRRLLSWLWLLLLGFLLAAEIADDAVSKAGRQTWDYVSPMMTRWLEVLEAQGLAFRR
jgi:hypothetical protein